MQSNEVHLTHPSGTRVVLIGTKHVSCTDGDQVAAAVARYQPHTVVLEVDEERYRQLHFRLAHLLDHDTETLMAITAGQDEADSNHTSSSSTEQQVSRSQGSHDCSRLELLQQLLPDALLWRQHHQQFQLMRNEGVPILLGSIYGSDMLQAALAAAALAKQAQAQTIHSANHAAAAAAGVTMHPQSPIQIVLADQEQGVTMQRFRALADGLGQLKQLLGELTAGVAYAEALNLPTGSNTGSNPCSSSCIQQHLSCSSSVNSDPAAETVTNHQHQQTLASLLTASVQLAASRLLHLCVQWLTMLLSSQAHWYGTHLHPVFWLSGNEQMQRELEDAGVKAVRPAAAAVARLMACAAKGRATNSSGHCGRDGGLPAAEDVAPVRQCVQSMEAAGSRGGIALGGASSYYNGITPCNNQQRSNRGCSASGSPHSSDINSEASGFYVQPWWVSLQRTLAQQQQQVNPTSAMAYEQAVMAERNAVLVDAVWDHAGVVDSDVLASGLTSPKGLASIDGINGGCSSSSNACTDSTGYSKPSSSWYNRSWSAGRTSATLNPVVKPKTPDVYSGTVLGVVGVNHLAGMEHQWLQKQQQWGQLVHHACNPQQVEGLPGRVRPAWGDITSSTTGGSRNSSMDFAPTMSAFGTARGSSSFGCLSPRNLVLVDLLADTLELCAVGAAGLGYWWAVKRATSDSHGFTNIILKGTAHAFSSPGKGFGAVPHGAKRLVLLLLPVAIALLPLQRDAYRFQEASSFLVRVARVNDQMMDDACYGPGASSLRMLASV